MIARFLSLVVAFFASINIVTLRREIVRLTELVRQYDWLAGHAADEIVRLRAEVERLSKELTASVKSATSTTNRFLDEIDNYEIELADAKTDRDFYIKQADFYKGMHAQLGNSHDLLVKTCDSWEELYGEVRDERNALETEVRELRREGTLTRGLLLDADKTIEYLRDVQDNKGRRIDSLLSENNRLEEELGYTRSHYGEAMEEASRLWDLCKLNYVNPEKPELVEDACFGYGTCFGCKECVPF